jgi:hypothetical protein
MVSTLSYDLIDRLMYEKRSTRLGGLKNSAWGERSERQECGLKKRSNAEGALQTLAWPRSDAPTVRARLGHDSWGSLRSPQVDFFNPPRRVNLTDSQLAVERNPGRAHHERGRAPRAEEA